MQKRTLRVTADIPWFVSYITLQTNLSSVHAHLKFKALRQAQVPLANIRRTHLVPNHDLPSKVVNVVNIHMTMRHDARTKQHSINAQTRNLHTTSVRRLDPLPSAKTDLGKMP